MTRISFRLKEGRDDDLVAWWKSLRPGDRSFHIRQTLRQGLFSQKATEGDLSAFRGTGNVIITPITPRKEIPGPTPGDLEEKLDKLANDF
jgi:hypothetical protein